MVEMWNNICISEDKIAYFYKVATYATDNASHSVLETVAKKHEKALKKINMPGGFYILPERIGNTQLREEYQSIYDMYGFPEFKDIIPEIIENTIHNNKTSKFTWGVYYYAIENRPELKSINSFFSNIVDVVQKDKPVKKGLMNAAKITEEFIQNQVRQHLGGVPVSIDDLRYIFHRIDYPFYPVSGRETDGYCMPTPTHLIFRYTDEVQEEKEVYVKHYTVVQDDDNIVNEASQGLSLLRAMQIPFALHIKYDLVHSKKFIKDLNAQKASMRKEQKRHRDWFEREDRRLQQKQQRINAAVDAVEMDSNPKIRWQATFRIFSDNEEQFKEITSHFNTYFFEAMKLHPVQLPGLQEQAYENFKPWKTTLQFIQHTDLTYFTNLNIIGGDAVGDAHGLAHTKNFQLKNVLLEDPFALLEKRRMKSGITEIVAGTSGSGKSMFVLNKLLEELVIAGIPIFKWNPKDDEKGLADKLPWLKPYMQYIELGSDDKHVGAFDPFRVHKDDVQLALDKAKELVKDICDCMKMQNIPLNEVDRAYKRMVESNQQLHMRNLYKELQKSERTDGSIIGDHLESASASILGRLFFSYDDQPEDVIVDVTKYFIVLTFKGINIAEEYNPYALSDVLTKRIFKSCESLVRLWSDYWEKRGIPGRIVTDEYAIIKRMGAEGVVATFSKQGRSWKKMLTVISQGVKEFVHAANNDSSIINLASSVMIGILNSQDEIDEAKNQFRLGESAVKFLQDRLAKTDAEQQTHDVQSREYPFIKNDANARTTIVEAQFNLPGFYSAYDSSLKENRKNRFVEESV